MDTFDWLTTFFDTWLGFAGLVIGFILSAYFGWKPLRSAVAGYLCGVVLVVLINTAAAGPTPCLPSSKGFDILRAYRTAC